MHRKTLQFAISLIFLSFSACVSTWDYPDGKVSSTSKTYTLDFPKGWTYLPTEGGRGLLSTFDGPLLQSIKVNEYDLSKELPYSKETIPNDIAIEDLSDALFQEYFKTPGLTGPTLESAAPAKLDQIDGVEIVFSYSNEEGLRYRAVSRAVIKDGTLYVIKFSAPTRHYFERYDDNLAATIESFVFTKSKS